MLYVIAPYEFSRGVPRTITCNFALHYLPTIKFMNTHLLIFGTFFMARRLFEIERTGWFCLRTIEPAINGQYDFHARCVAHDKNPSEFLFFDTAIRPSPNILCNSASAFNVFNLN